jgi:hypothetical protein
VALVWVKSGCGGQCRRSRLLSAPAALFLGWVLLFVAAQLGYGQSPASPPLPTPPDTKNCGRQCLYVLLRLHGINVTEREIDRFLPVGERGTSMYDLQQCARYFGLETEVVELSPEELEKAPLPAIVHLGPTKEEGHYLVLVHVLEPKFPRFIDGTRGSFSWARAEFARSWSGYALVSKDRWWLRWLSRLAALVALVAGGLWFGKVGKQMLHQASH